MILAQVYFMDLYPKKKAKNRNIFQLEVVSCETNKNKKKKKLSSSITIHHDKLIVDIHYSDIRFKSIFIYVEMIKENTYLHKAANNKSVFPKCFYIVWLEIFRAHWYAISFRMKNQ